MRGKCLRGHRRLPDLANQLPGRIPNVERTLVIAKPDAVRRGLVGEVISRFERKNLKIAALDVIHIESDMAKRHYREHEDKPFFAELVSFIVSGPVVAMVVQGEEAVSVVRTLVGATDPKEAAPGTIRGDFGLTIGENLVHGSDSAASAAREVALFFPRLA